MALIPQSSRIGYDLGYSAKTIRALTSLRKSFQEISNSDIVDPLKKEAG